MPKKGGKRVELIKMELIMKIGRKDWLDEGRTYARERDRENEIIGKMTHAIKKKKKEKGKG